MNVSISELINLKGRTALVTGAAGHIGATACEVLAELGADIFMVDKDSAGLEKVKTQLSDQYKTNLFPVTADLESPDAAQTIFDNVSSQANKLDILINNAAFVGTTDVPGWGVELENQSIETWERAMRVNLTAPFAIIQAFSAMLQHSKIASVVNLGSIYGIIGPDMSLYEGLEMGSPAAYAASKGGLIQLTRWLASALAPAVRVNAISPGGLLREQPEAFRERYEAKTLLGRMATEQDLKGAIAYLASDLSAYVTGQNLMVDGGWTAI